MHVSAQGYGVHYTPENGDRGTMSTPFLLVLLLTLPARLEWERGGRVRDIKGTGDMRGFRKR